MLKALKGEGTLWLTRVRKAAWKFRKTPRDWQTGVIIPISKKGNRKQYTNFRGSLLGLPGKIYAKCLEQCCSQSHLRVFGHECWIMTRDAKTSEGQVRSACTFNTVRTVITTNIDL